MNKSQHVKSITFPNASWELFICFESSRTENFDVEHPRVATFKGHQSIIFQTLVRGLYVAVHLTKLRTIKWLQTPINYSGCPTQTNWCHFHEIIHPSVYPTAPRFVILFEQCSKTRCHYWLVENRIPHGSNRLVIFGEYDPRNNHPIGFLNTAHLIPPWFPKPPQRLSILVALCCVDFLWAMESEAKADLMGNHWFTRGIGPIQKVPKPLIHDITHNIMINIVHHVLIFFSYLFILLTFPYRISWVYRGSAGGWLQNRLATCASSSLGWGQKPVAGKVEFCFL